MSFNGFTVATDELRRIASAIDELAGRFDSVAQRRVGYEGQADAPPVDDGLRDFFGHWTDAMGRLHGQLDHLGACLRGAHETYDDVERKVADAARRP
jgi:hypothetical protein